jgi:transcriptional antiterminator NusG
MAKNWYVVQTHSNCEPKAKKSLEERMRMENLTEFFGEIMIPMESVVEMVNGQKKDRKVKFFPSYILVQMEMNDRTKSLVKNTPKVLGFLGSDPLNPTPVPEREVTRITSRVQEGTQAPKPKIQYAQGDNVRVIDGPFSNFSGTVEEVQADKGKVRVQISIFGRATPVTLDFMQVEKT